MDYLGHNRGETPHPVYEGGQARDAKINFYRSIFLKEELFACVREQSKDNGSTDESVDILFSDNFKCLARHLLSCVEV